MNCGTDTAGSCHGGSHTGTYEFIKKEAGFVPYDTCMPYIACSSESNEGFCNQVDTTCKPINTCRTCNTFEEHGGTCVEIASFPNATSECFYFICFFFFIFFILNMYTLLSMITNIKHTMIVAEFGSYGMFSSDKVHKIKAEIFARGPVAAGVNAIPIVDYKGGVVKDRNIFHKLINHVVSIVGWGVEDDTEYWIVRNSWGTYWGKFALFKIIADRIVSSLLQYSISVYSYVSNIIMLHYIQ